MKTIIAIHSIGKGTCSFSNKTADGAVVTFANGQVKEKHLTWASLKKLAEFSFGKEEENADGKDAESTAKPIAGEDISANPKR